MFLWFCFFEFRMLCHTRQRQRKSWSKTIFVFISKAVWFSFEILFFPQGLCRSRLTRVQGRFECDGTPLLSIPLVRSIFKLEFLTRVRLWERPLHPWWFLLEICQVRGKFHESLQMSRVFSETIFHTLLTEN